MGAGLVTISVVGFAEEGTGGGFISVVPERDKAAAFAVVDE
jgi:hypothetical protein